MPAPIISIEHLSKRYLIGHRSARRERYTALRDVLWREARNFVRKTADLVRGRQIVQGDEVEDFWALKDISFDVQQGEVIGIIGRNGAGKSTLLKILSRITEPTEGRVVLRGRVASLLEVGTGFHPELTGRENIFLNGAILGMTQREIRRKFDEIVAFAGVERFVDTPAKRYSSGMYVRLAFAVAAHLEPEILIVDEVLAVGDTEFQKKCLGKMHDVATHEGRTVLLVSHNHAAVSELADRAVLLSSGRVSFVGAVPEALTRYFSASGAEAVYVRSPHNPTRGPHLSRVEIVTSEPNGTHQFGKPLSAKFWISHRQSLVSGCFSFQIVNQYQQPIVHVFAYHPETRFGATPGQTILTCEVPRLRLNVGLFHLRTFLSEPPGGEMYESLDDICHFEIIRTDETVLWGWRPEACAYHEDWNWTVDASPAADGHGAP